MQEKKDSPVSSVVQVRDDELRQMRDRLHLLESRVENQEKLNSANMYMLRGFPKKPEETVTVMIVRAFQEVFGMKIDPMSILNVIPVGYDAKMEAPMLKVAFPASLHEKIKLALQGPDNPMKKYNKDNRTSVQCFRSLSSVQLKHFNRSKNAAAMIRQKEAGLLVSVSSENYKIRVGGKGCKVPLTWNDRPHGRIHIGRIGYPFVPIPEIYPDEEGNFPSRFLPLITSSFDGNNFTITFPDDSNYWFEYLFDLKKGTYEEIRKEFTSDYDAVFDCFHPMGGTVRIEYGTDQKIFCKSVMTLSYRNGR